MLCHCTFVLFPSQSSLVEKVLPTTVKKTMNHHVLPNLAFAIVIYISFNLWMSCDNVDIFALVINFLNDNWVPMHVIFGLFEVNETIEQSMAI
jgi:hypothetical protein